MTDGRPNPVSVPNALRTLSFLPDRTPSLDAQSSGAFEQLARYRDGGIFIGHWAGSSEWERHTLADEIVMIVEGSTTIFFLMGEEEQSAPLSAGELVIVPEGVWHRFETPDFVKVLSVTPQPTDHRSDRPS